MALDIHSFDKQFYNPKGHAKLSVGLVRSRLETSSTLARSSGCCVPLTGKACLRISQGGKQGDFYFYHMIEKNKYDKYDLYTVLSLALRCES